MPIDVAKPQDTYDHIFGSGALGWHWWIATRYIQGVDGKTFEAADDWKIEVTCDDGNDGEKTVVVDHAAVLKAARSIAKSKPKYASDSLVRQCKNLLFRADEADLDAPVADELLQFIVLGEIVFG